MLLPTSDTKSNTRVYAGAMAACLIAQTLQTFQGLMMPNPNPHQSHHSHRVHPETALHSHNLNPILTLFYSCFKPLNDNDSVSVGVGVGVGVGARVIVRVSVSVSVSRALACHGPSPSPTRRLLAVMDSFDMDIFRFTPESNRGASQDDPATQT